MCEVSELFERAIARLSGSVDPYGLDEILANFSDLAERDPDLAGVPHPEHDGIYVHESPALSRLPSIIFIFSVDRKAGVVRLWNCRILGS